MLILESNVDLIRLLLFDIRDNIKEHKSLYLQNIPEAPLLLTNRFFISRESNTSLTILSVYSQISQHVSSSILLIRDMQISLKIEDLAS